MSIYGRDEIFPEWEPSPWPMKAAAADEQERGFHARATQKITWGAIQWDAFPDAGVFGLSKDWLRSADVAFFAVSEQEQLLLIENSWSGWPDPPRWGLVSRPTNQRAARWSHWGHFPDLPETWHVPGNSPTSAGNAARR